MEKNNTITKPPPHSCLVKLLRPLKLRHITIDLYENIFLDTYIHGFKKLSFFAQRCVNNQLIRSLIKDTQSEQWEARFPILFKLLFSFKHIQ